MSAVDPGHLVTTALQASVTDLAPATPVEVVAAGKAAWAMAAAFARHAHDRPVSGIVTGPRGRQAELPDSFEWFDSGHPLPDEASERAARRALSLARGEPPSALVVLLSGGASAMLAAPAHGITLADKIETTQSLMRAGLSIDGLNCVRKHLSAIKGGQLAAGVAHALTFAISDVHAPAPDDPSVIGSGPTVADPTTFADARAIIDRASARGATIPAAVRRRIERGARGEIEETPKPGDARLRRSTYRVIGNRKTAMDGAASAARALGFAVHVLTGPTSGEARHAGARFARVAARIDQASGSPVCVIASGETTVRVRGAGRGGRNLEFALGMAAALRRDFGARGVRAAGASAGTDGIDGPTDAAGAVVDSSTLARAARAGLDPADALARNDTYPLFQRLGDLILWGPTGTNVGDLQVFLKW